LPALDSQGKAIHRPGCDQKTHLLKIGIPFIGNRRRDVEAAQIQFGGGKTKFGAGVIQTVDEPNIEFLTGTYDVAQVHEYFFRRKAEFPPFFAPEPEGGSRSFDERRGHGKILSPGGKCQAEKGRPVRIHGYSSRESRILRATV